MISLCWLLVWGQIRDRLFKEDAKVLTLHKALQTANAKDMLYNQYNLDIVEAGLKKEPIGHIRVKDTASDMIKSWSV